MRATLSDVARRAGVSEATASRALNGQRYVAPTTRVRVEDAIRALDYIPHRAARDLSRARTATVAMLVHRSQYPAHGEGTFGARVLDGVSRALTARGYDLLYLSLDDGPGSQVRSLGVVRTGRADGALLLGPAIPRAAIAPLRDAGLPLVLVDNRSPGVDAVLADNRRGSTELARHLVADHGYRRLACLAGPARWPSTAERVAAVRQVAGAAGAELRVVHATGTTMRDGAQAAGELLDDLPQAIVGVNDAMAIGALHRLRGMGAHRRPAVVGHDDIAWARLTDPPLTTVRIDAAAMGEAAARLLVARIEGDQAPPGRLIRVPVRLLLRRSCGCGIDRNEPEDRMEAG